MDGRADPSRRAGGFLAAGFAGFFLCAAQVSAEPIIRTVPDGPPLQAATPIPQPEEGVYHILEPGQTLYAVHRAYQVPVAALIDANGIADPTRIRSGTPLFVPGATRVLAVPTPGRPVLAWPLDGPITSGFGARGESGHHGGIDIDGEMGQEVRAAATGLVVRAGTEGHYGRRVLIDHGDGLVTFYAHASKLLVSEGEPVLRGQPIAEVGRSGNARGTHLHFEARRSGRPVDPIPLLAATITASASRGRGAGRN